MATPYLAEIRIFACNFAPKGWALCTGQLLPINQNQALFALLGTTYGGNGQTTFALPNLQGRVPVDPGWSVMPGQQGGEETHTLTGSELPTHTHEARGGAATSTQYSPAGAIWGEQAAMPYATASDGEMAPGVIRSVGSNQPHSNMQPYLALNFCIALQGIFPSHN